MIVLDSNILFSALIKNSKTRDIILRHREKFLFPEYIFTEINNHKPELIAKSSLPEKEFNILLEALLKNTIIVSEKELLRYRKEAINIIGDIDLNDAVFIACALAYPKSIIWSDDKKLRQQKHIPVVNTTEMARMTDNR